MPQIKKSLNFDKLTDPVLIKGFTLDPKTPVIISLPQGDLVITNNKVTFNKKR